MKIIRLWFKNFKFKENWGELITVVSPIIFSVMFGVSEIKEYIGMKWFVTLIVFLAIMTLSGWLISIKNNESISKLSGKYLKLKDQKEHIEGILASLPEEFCKLLAIKWGLNGDSRITIYRYTSEHFIPVSRYSKNPEYDSINRKSYPKDVGYISKCWAVEGGMYFKNLPDPVENEREYLDYVNKETRMLKKDLKELSMKSRSYYGKTLYDGNDKAFLIVMIESINCEIHSIEEIKTDLEGTISEFVISIVMSNITPRGGQTYE